MLEQVSLDLLIMELERSKRKTTLSLQTNCLNASELLHFSLPTQHRSVFPDKSMLPFLIRMCHSKEPFLGWGKLSFLEFLFTAELEMIVHHLSLSIFVYLKIHARNDNFGGEFPENRNQGQYDVD